MNLLKRSIYLAFTTVLLLIMVGSVVAQDGSRVLRVASATEVDTLNPYLTGLGPSHTNIYLMFRGPWVFDDTGELLPVFVDELPIDVEGGVTENEEGNTVVRFTLNDRAVWSDGTPITADDFIFPFEAANDGVTNFVQPLDDEIIGTVTAGESDREVVVTYLQLVPDWYTAGWWPLPAHVLRPLYEEALANGDGLQTLDWNRAPTVGNGPFLFNEWVTGSFMRFVRNENFYSPAWFEEVVVSFYPDSTVVRTIVQNGEADISSFGQPNDVFDFIDDPNFVIGSLPAGVLESWFLNLGEKGHPALKDIRVREALVMALDRELFTEELLGGLTTVPDSFWYGSPWAMEGLQWPQYNPESAVELLAEAGWVDTNGNGFCEAQGVEGVEDGTPLEFTLNTTAASLRMDAQVLAQDILAESCISLRLVTVEPSLMLAPLDAGGAQRSGDDDIYHFAVLAARLSIAAPNYWNCDNIPDEDNPAVLNLAHACWPEIDDLWDTLTSEPDPDVRQETANIIQEFMAENLHWIPMWDRPSIVIHTSQLENVRLVPEDISYFRALFWQIHEWERAG